MPGQTMETPDETDPLRKFYVSTFAQKPSSDMAQEWLVKRGYVHHYVP